MSNPLKVIAYIFYILSGIVFFMAFLQMIFGLMNGEWTQLGTGFAGIIGAVILAFLGIIAQAIEEHLRYSRYIAKRLSDGNKRD
jgi:hypothetical protein